MCYHWTFHVEYEKVDLWLFIIHFFDGFWTFFFLMLYRDSILLFHGIKIIHACFYRILSWFQFYSPHSLSLTKFPSPPWSRHLPLGRLGPTPGNRGGARLLPQLPSSRPPVCCLGLRALQGREPAPRRTPGTSGASGRPGGQGPPGAVCAARREPPSGRREPVPSRGTLATPAKAAARPPSPGQSSRGRG